MGRREIQASREAGGWSVAGSFKGRRTGGRKEGREGWRDEGMKGPVGPDGWERFCLGLRARWRRVSEADRQTASGIGGGGLPRLADSSLSSARRLCIHRAERAAAAAAGNGVFGAGRPVSVYFCTLTV